MCTSNPPFKAANRFDVYFHLSKVHDIDESDPEIDKLVIRPHDLRKILCLECSPFAALENAQWLCKLVICLFILFMRAGTV